MRPSDIARGRSRHDLPGLRIFGFVRALSAKGKRAAPIQRVRQDRLNPRTPGFVRALSAIRQEPARIRRTRRDRQNLRIFGFVCAPFGERDRLVRLLPGRRPVIPVGHFARPEGLCPGELCSRRSARDGSSNHPHAQVRRGPVVVSSKKKCVQSSLCGRIWDHQSQASRIGADSPAIHGTSARARPPPSTIDRIANRTPSFMRRREWAIYLIICSGISGFAESIARIPGSGILPLRGDSQRGR